MELAAPDRSELVDLGRMRLRVWEWGAAADPAVLCVHGAYDHGRMWDGIAPRLVERGLRVVAPDLRGHGDSGRLSSGQTWAAMVLDLALLVRRIGPPVGLLGHSFGGGQVLTVAATWPELVPWVVNIDGLGPPSAAFEERDMVEAATTGLAMAERVRTAPPRVHASRADMADRRQRINVRLPREWIEHLVEHGSREVEGGFVWKSDPLFGVGLPMSFDLASIEAEHERVTCPVLVLTGSEADTWSELTPDELVSRLRHLPGARHQVVTGAGHYAHIEQLDAVTAIIGSFLDEIGTPP
ncbi:MAG: alpha/beta hydrolase [Acidimicrobiales bacterium]